MIAVLTTLGVALLLIAALLSAITLATILRLRFVPPRTELLAQLPEDAQSLLAPGLAQLQALGFAEPAALRLSHLRVAGAELQQHGLVLLHSGLPAAAYVLQMGAPDRGRRWTLFFVSRTQGGRTLATRNRGSVSGPLPLPDITTQDCWMRDWPSVWRAHRHRMKAMQPKKSAWQQLSAAEWIAAGGAAERAAFDVRVARGDLRPAGDGSWRFGLRCALLMLARAWLTARAASRGMHGDAPAAAGANAVEQQVATFEREAGEQRSGSGSSNGAKWLLFFATAGAAAASFGLSMDLRVVPALVAVLLFHELGHFAAMRWAGYRDLKVFFLPFLGAAVSGRHDHPTATQELIVLFAGPVPGLLLGLAALWWGLPQGLPFADSDFWHSCALLAVTINAFNLLPIHPLDGGKIFEILLLGRWPWLAFGARALGIVAFAGIAMTTDSTIGRGVLWGLVLLMALGLAHQRDEARLAVALRSRNQLGGHSRGDALQALFGAMQNIGLGAKPWASQRLLAQALLPVMTRAPLSRSGRAGGLLVYGFFLGLPLLALVASIGWVPRAATAAAASAAAARPAVDPNGTASLNALFVALQARVDAEPDAVRRWALLVDEFGDQVELIATNGPGQLPAAEALLRDAEPVAAAQPDAASARARLALWQAHATADDNRRMQRLLDLLARYDDAATAPADKEPLLRASLAWLYESRRAEPALRARVIDRALAQSAALPSHSRWPLYEFKADQWLAQGEGETALREARAWSDAERLSSEPGAAERAARLRVDVRLALHGPAAALQELDAQLPALAALPPQRQAELAKLRRYGMQLAEVTGRTDWQRAQVGLLPPPARPEAGLPWWMRPLVRDQPLGWMELEHRHWRGDAEGAQQVADDLKKRRPGAPTPAVITAGADEVGPLASARMRVTADARIAVARRYGLSTNVPS